VVIEATVAVTVEIAVIAAPTEDFNAAPLQI